MKWIFVFASIAAIALHCGGETCKQASFVGSVTSTESCIRAIAPALNFRLTPLKDNWGWVISAGGEDSSEDWTYPVTFPIRTGEVQNVGTGYGGTVQRKMTYPTVVQFLVTHADFEQYSRLANDTLESTRPEAAGAYTQKVAELRTGSITLTPLSYKKGASVETIRSMKFRIVVNVPSSLSSQSLSWVPASCPK